MQIFLNEKLKKSEKQLVSEKNLNEAKTFIETEKSTSADVCKYFGCKQLIEAVSKHSNIIQKITAYTPNKIEHKMWIFSYELKFVHH